MRLKPPKGAMLDRGHPFSKGLVGCWLMNEGGGNKIYDLSGNGNTNDFVNSPIWVPGKFGSAVDFEKDSAQYTNFQNTAFQVGVPFTITAWIKIETAGIYQGIISTDSFGFVDAVYWGVEFDVASDNRLRIHYGDGTGGALGDRRTLDQNAGTTISAGVWYFVVGIMTGPITGSLWINGISQSFTTSGTGGLPIGYSVNPGGIGRMNSVNYFDGSIDNVMIYNRALSASEIQQLYLNPFCMFGDTL